MSINKGEAHTELINKLDEVKTSATTPLIAVNTGGSLSNTTASVQKPNTMVFGTDSVGSSSQYNPIRVDATGVQYVSNVSTQNIAPANSVNSGTQNDPANSVAVGLRARTTIADATTETFLKCDAAGVLQTTASHSDKITQGYDTTVAAGGDGLQQVLIYGRENGGDLRALECVGDRLIVDCIELSPTGPHTPSSLPGVGIYGQVDSTSGYKNLNVDSSGILKIQNSKITQGEGNITGGGDGLQQILCYGKDQSGNLDPLNVDNNGHLKITLNDIESGITNSIKTVVDSQTKSVTQYASQSISGSSTNGGTYIPFKSIMITSEDTGSGTHNVGFVNIDSPPDFMQIHNVDAGGVTLDIIVSLSN